MKCALCQIDRKLCNSHVVPDFIFMSLLWRFAVTTNPWLKGANVGPHAERLRRLLLKSDPVEPWRYGCLITVVLDDRVHLPDLIVPPSLCRVEGHYCHRLVVGGF